MTVAEVRLWGTKIGMVAEEASDAVRSSLSGWESFAESAKLQESAAQAIAKQFVNPQAEEISEYIYDCCIKLSTDMVREGSKI